MSDLLRAAANLAGVPGVSVPCGLSDEGLPVGLQVLGPRGSDARLLAAAAAFQRETTFHLARPPEQNVAA
jgi:aspartyl-tRNA(Asn)/glutamyl-tRNA(Gln) amidotransferase subunit A